jgi:hypothetical protein
LIRNWLFPIHAAHGAAEFGEVEVFAIAFEDAGGQQQVGALLVVPAPARAHPGLAPAGRRDGRARAGQGMAVAGHDVDHAQQGVGAVHARSGAGDEFDALHQVHVDQAFQAQHGLVVDGVVGAHAVDHQDEAAVVVARTQEAASAQVGIVAVASREQAGQGGQGFAQGAPAETADLA